MHFLWHANLQLANQVFRSCWKEDILKTTIFIVLLKHNFDKFSLKMAFCKEAKIGERWWIRRKRSLIGPKPENRKTRIGTKMCHKNPQKPIFVVWNGTSKVVLFLALEVVLKLTLEMLKSGTKTNSPIYIYIYVYMAKASFSAYALGKNMLKHWGKVYFSTKKKHNQFWSSFLFLPFSLLPRNG